MKAINDGAQQESEQVLELRDEFVEEDVCGFSVLVKDSHGRADTSPEQLVSPERRRMSVVVGC